MLQASLTRSLTCAHIHDQGEEERKKKKKKIHCLCQQALLLLITMWLRFVQ